MTHEQANLLTLLTSTDCFRIYNPDEDTLICEKKGWLTRKGFYYEITPRGRAALEAHVRRDRWLQIACGVGLIMVVFSVFAIVALLILDGFF